MPVPKRRQSHTRGAKRKAVGRRSPPPTPSAPVPPAEAAPPGLRELRVLRGSSSDRGRVARGGKRAPEGPSARRILGVRFRDGSLRQLALTHRSYAFENELPANNERLEFLGDAVLGIVVTDMAFGEFPEMPEGELAKLRAAIVNMGASPTRRDLGLGRFVLLGAARR